MHLYPFDDDYVRRLRDGDASTEEHFVRYFSELLLIKLRARRLHAAAIDDLRQEVFARVFRALRMPDGIRDGRRLGSFVNAVCNNVLLESFRGRRDLESVGEEHHELRDEGVSAEEALVTVETVAQVRKILERMGPKDAELLRSAFLDERDKGEICRDFGVDRDYLRVLLHRAKERFRAAFRARQEITALQPRDTETGKPSLRQ